MEAQRIAAAQHLAQALFKIALDDALAHGKWDDELVAHYRNAERGVDELLLQEQFDQAHADLERMQAQDPEAPDYFGRIAELDWAEVELRAAWGDR